MWYFWAKVITFLKTILGLKKPAILGGTDLTFKNAQIEHYDFIVLGLGNDGGPLATRLATAGHRTLLMETRDPKNISVTFVDSATMETPSAADNAAWNSFANNYLHPSDAAQARDCNAKYKTRDGQLFIGAEPPQGSRMIGTLHPKTMSLGSCMAHLALITMYQPRPGADSNPMIMGNESWRIQDFPQLKCTLFDSNRTRGVDYNCEQCLSGESYKVAECDTGIWTLS